MAVLTEVLRTFDLALYLESLSAARYAQRVALRIGLPREEAAAIADATLLHDIGKTGLPHSLLYKPGPLDAEEQRVVRRHPEIGADILAAAGERVEDLIPVAISHHERVDGTGYPFGLSGDRIPLCAKIAALADSFVAMVSNRCYEPALSVSAALREIERGAGTQFDARLAETFADVVEEDLRAASPAIARVFRGADAPALAYAGAVA